MSQVIDSSAETQLRFQSVKNENTLDYLTKKQNKTNKQGKKMSTGEHCNKQKCIFHYHCLDARIVIAYLYWFKHPQKMFPDE